LRFTVHNSGIRKGSEIIQVYVGNLTQAHYFASKELKAFEKINLSPRQDKTVDIELNERDFSFYHPGLGRFVVASGEYEVCIGASSRDIRLSGKITKEGEADLPKDSSWESSWYAHRKGKPSDEDFKSIYDRGLQSEESGVRGKFTIDSTLEDMGHTMIGKMMKKVSRGMLVKAGGFKKEDRHSNEFKMMFQFVMTTPLRTTMLLSQGQLSQSMANGIVDLANGKYLKGLRCFLRK
jgi:beta-glucosidase